MPSRIDKTVSNGMQCQGRQARDPRIKASVQKGSKTLIILGNFVVF